MDNFYVDKNTKKKRDFLKAKGDIEKLKKEEAGVIERETNEVLRAGQPNRKKAIKEIDKIETERQKEAKVEKDDQLNALDMKKRFRASYKSQLAKTLSELLTMLDWLRGWTAEVVVTSGSPIAIYGKPFQTKDGILLVVKTAKQNIMHKGMLVTNDPTLDYAGLYNICLQVENTMDKARGLLLSSPSTMGMQSGIVNKHGQSIGSNAKP